MKSRPIEGFEDLYAVTNDGRVISYGGKSNHSNEIFLKGSKDKDGYLRCTLQKNGKRFYFRVCRLVAKVFVKNPLNLPIVNHKDEDKTNDHFKNLEWSTNYGNWKHSFPNKEIRVVRTCVKTGKQKRFKSLMEAARESKINQGNLTNCLKGRCKSVGGFKWQVL